MTRLLIAFSFVASLMSAADPNVFESVRAERDQMPDPNPDAAFWRGLPGIFPVNDSFGKPGPFRSEVRSRWTPENLYFLFVCPYDTLHLKPNPDTRNETYQLWDWDVAEAFLGSDFENIKRYKEFEVSPRGEWVDLDIDLASPHHEDGWKWNSGFTVATRIDEAHHVWYAVMRIPWKSLDTRPAAPGIELRANFYRMQGAPPKQVAIAWRPTRKRTFHAPESFGILRLVAGR